MNRTLIIGIGAIAGALIVGFGAYFLLFAGQGSGANSPLSGTSLPTAGSTSTATTASTAAGQQAGTGTGNSAPGIGAPQGRLLEVSAGPVVPGAAVIDAKKGTASTTGATIRFIERESGNVYDYATLARTTTRVNNKTLPGIQSATWLPDGSTAIVRYLSGTDHATINTYVLPASGSSGFFLAEDLAGAAASATRLLALASSADGSSASLMRLDGSRATTVFSTPLSSVRAAFAGPDNYLVFTKPSAALAGYAYLVNAYGRFTTVAGPLDGLVALPSPSGKWLFVSYAKSNGTMATELVDTATHAVTALPLATIADKCVWTSDSTTLYCGVPESPPSGYNYPDDWYQGAVAFSDRLWKVSVSSRYAELVTDFSGTTAPALDLTGLAIDPSGSLLTFVNKTDGSLWSYAL